MNSTTTIEVPIGSGVDGLIGILIIVGAVIGYKRGVIVECIGFFAVLVWLTICVNISKSVYGYLTETPRSDVPDLFAIIIMTTLFVAGLVFLVSKVNFKTQEMLQSTVLGPSARYLGAFFGASKYYLISAVFLVTIFKVDEHARFLPDPAKYSRLSRASIYLITRAYPYLLLKEEDNKLYEYPSGSGH